jgi:hypothetical protein
VWKNEEKNVISESIEVIKIEVIEIKNDVKNIVEIKKS